MMLSDGSDARSRPDSNPPVPLYKNADWENAFGGGRTCRHEKANLLGKLIPMQGDQLTDLGRGRVALEHAIRRTTQAQEAYENACPCAHFVGLPPRARDDHASRRPAASVNPDERGSKVRAASVEPGHAFF
jgi:hypothetical protein